MHQVPVHISGEDVADVLRRKRVATIRSASAGGREESAHFFFAVELVLVIALLADGRPLLSPRLRLSERKDRNRGLAVIGDIYFHRARIEQRHAHQVLHRQHDMPQVDGVLCRKSIPPVVEGHAKLSGARRRLGHAADGMKAEIAATHLNGRPLGVIGRCDQAVVARIGGVDPVVDAQPQVGDAAFRVEFSEAGIEHLPDVGFAVAVGVFHEKNIGSAGNDQASFPRHQAADLQHLIGEDDAAVDLAVAVGVFEQPDARARRLARRRIFRVVEHLGHVDSPVFVERHFDGVHHLRLGGEQLDVEVLAKMEAFQSILRRERRRALFLGASDESEKRQEEGRFCEAGHEFTL